MQAHQRYAKRNSNTNYFQPSLAYAIDHTRQNKDENDKHNPKMCSAYAVSAADSQDHEARHSQATRPEEAATHTRWSQRFEYVSNLPHILYIHLPAPASAANRFAGALIKRSVRTAQMYAHPEFDEVS